LNPLRWCLEEIIDSQIICLAERNHNLFFSWNETTSNCLMSLSFLQYK
jgi:hypothetical protein